MTFDDAAAHHQWFLPRQARSMRNQQSRRFPWSVAMGALTIGVAGFAIIRSRRKARVAS